MVIDPLKEFPGYALRRASAAFMAKLAARLAVLDLRPAEATVLLVIGSNPGITQSEIGRLLDIASANIAPLVGRLADRDLLLREPVDGRSHALTLSEAGRRLTQKARQIIEDLESTLLERIPQSLRGAFLAALRAIAGANSD